MSVLKLVLFGVVILFVVAIVQVVVSGLRNKRPWPRKQHLGHWREWDDEEED